MFPGLEEALGVRASVDGNIDQHRGFSGGLEKLKRYAEDPYPRIMTVSRSSATPSLFQSFISISRMRSDSYLHEPVR